MGLKVSISKVRKDKVIKGWLIYSLVFLLNSTSSVAQIHGSEDSELRQELQSPRCFEDVDIEKLRQLDRSEDPHELCQLESELLRVARVPDSCSLENLNDNRSLLKKMRHLGRCHREAQLPCRDKVESYIRQRQRLTMRQSDKPSIWPLDQTAPSKSTHFENLKLAATEKYSPWIFTNEPLESPQSLFDRSSLAKPPILDRTDLAIAWSQHLIHNCWDYRKAHDKLSIHLSDPRFSFIPMENEKPLLPAPLAKGISEKSFENDCWPFLWADVDPHGQKPRRYVILVSGLSTYRSDPLGKAMSRFSVSEKESLSLEPLVEKSTQMNVFRKLDRGPTDYLRHQLQNSFDSRDEILEFPHHPTDRLFRCVQRILTDPRLAPSPGERPTVALIGYSNGAQAIDEVAHRLDRSQLSPDAMVYVDPVARIPEQLFFGYSFRTPKSVPPSSVLVLAQDHKGNLYDRIVRGDRVEVSPGRYKRIPVPESTHAMVVYDSTDVIQHFLETQVPRGRTSVKSAD